MIDLSTTNIQGQTFSGPLARKHQKRYPAMKEGRNSQFTQHAMLPLFLGPTQTHPHSAIGHKS